MDWWKKMGMLYNCAMVSSGKSSSKRVSEECAKANTDHIELDYKQIPKRKIHCSYF